MWNNIVIIQIKSKTRALFPVDNRTFYWQRCSRIIFYSKVRFLRTTILFTGHENKRNGQATALDVLYFGLIFSKTWMQTFAHHDQLHTKCVPADREATRRSLLCDIQWLFCCGYAFSCSAKISLSWDGHNSYRSRMRWTVS